MKTLLQYISEDIDKDLIDTTKKHNGKLTGDQRLFVETLGNYFYFRKQFENTDLVKRVKLTPKMLNDKFKVPSRDPQYRFDKWYCDRLPNSILKEIFDECGYTDDDLDYCRNIMKYSVDLIRAMYSNMLKSSDPLDGAYVSYNENTGEFSDLNIAPAEI